jgi:hypothetical protein
VSVTRPLVADESGDAIVECVHTEFAVADPAVRRLAGINLGPIASGTRITCHLEILDPGTAELTVTWIDGHTGPLPIRLGTA